MAAGADGRRELLTPSALMGQNPPKHSACKERSMTHTPDWCFQGMCITLIGMPGAGKSTVGHALARHLGWGFVDTDYLIESVYGTVLQNVADALEKEAFLDVEATVVASLRAKRIVVATGGSVVYRSEAMRQLLAMGPVIHLEATLPLILERIARKPDRGLAIAPGQTIEDIFRERQALYHKYALCSIPVDVLTPQECAEAVLDALRRRDCCPENHSFPAATA